VTTITPAALDRTPAAGRDAGLLGLLAFALRVPALLAPTNLGYDDGGYGLAVVAMREGHAPFRDVFSPQGPLFLPLMRVADLVGLETMNAPRLLSVLAGVVVSVAVYFAARELMDRPRALLAGGLTAISGVLLWTTGPLTGDGPAAAFATTAVAVALAYRRAPSAGKVVAITLLAGGALSVKSLLVGPALLVAWLLVASRRRWTHALAVVLGALAVVLLVSLPWGLGHVYDDYVAYHLDKTADRKPLANLDKLVTTFARRDTVLVAVLLLGLGWALARRLRAHPDHPSQVEGGRLERALSGSRVLWWWAGTAFVVLLAQDPMFRNHLTALVAPLALLAAWYRPPWKAVAVAVVVTLGFQVVELRPLLWPEDYTGTDAQIVEALRDLPASAWVISDAPGLVWRAGKSTDPFYVDASVLRIHSNVEHIQITEDRLVDAAANPKVCAVVVTAKVRFGSFTHLPERLAELGYEPSADVPAVYVRPNCDPPT